MAVQAQYPSHIITHQDSSSLQLQSQPQPFLLHHPTDFHSTVEQSNSRKRRRDIDMNQLMSLLQHQQQQLQNQNVDVSTGLKLSFNDQQHLQHHYHQQQQHSLSSRSSVFSEDISTQITQQRYEIDRFLHTQSEELRRTLANKRQVHYHALIRTAEESIYRRMKDKDVEAEKATRRNLELEARAAHLSAEAQVWQARARQQEIEAAALQSQLNDAIVRSGRRLGKEGEVGLTCASGDVDDAESAYIDPDRVVLMSGPGCKACGRRVASVVLLPCRHLCVCTECDGVVSACPLCLSFRSSSIEVLSI